MVSRKFQRVSQKLCSPFHEQILEIRRKKPAPTVHAGNLRKNTHCQGGWELPRRSRGRSSSRRRRRGGLVLFNPGTTVKFEDGPFVHEQFLKMIETGFLKSLPQHRPSKPFRVDRACSRLFVLARNIQELSTVPGRHQRNFENWMLAALVPLMVTCIVCRPALPDSLDEEQRPGLALAFLREDERQEGLAVRFLRAPLQNAWRFQEMRLSLFSHPASMPSKISDSRSLISVTSFKSIPLKPATMSCANASDFFK